MYDSREQGYLELIERGRQKHYDVLVARQSQYQGALAADKESVYLIRRMNQVRAEMADFRESERERIKGIFDFAHSADPSAVLKDIAAKFSPFGFTLFDEEPVAAQPSIAGS
jgi:uncharacterized membrane protein